MLPTRAVKLHALQRLFWATGIYLSVEFRLGFHPSFEWAFFMVKTGVLFLYYFTGAYPTYFYCILNVWTPFSSVRVRRLDHEVQVTNIPEG
jgi:hypothetical protein